MQWPKEKYRKKNNAPQSTTHSAGFTYRLDRLKPRASQFRGPPVKVYSVFLTSSVIGLSHLCCHNVLYFLNNPSVIFLPQLHSTSEYCRISNTPIIFALLASLCLNPALTTQIKTKDEATPIPL